MVAIDTWYHLAKDKLPKVLSALKGISRGSSGINLIWNHLGSSYEVFVVVVIATTLLLEQYTWVYDRVSSGYFWGVRLVSWADSDRYNG